MSINVVENSRFDEVAIRSPSLLRAIHNAVPTSWFTRLPGGRFQATKKAALGSLAIFVIRAFHLFCICFTGSIGSSHASGVDGQAFQWDCTGSFTNVVDFTPPSGLTNIVAVSAGRGHNLALRKDGTLVSWGSENNTPPAGLNNVVAIAAGQGYSLALRDDGTVVAWGLSSKVPAELSNVVAIAASDYMLALRSDGTVISWGTARELPEGLTNVVAIATSGSRDSNLALKSDGRVIGWGSREGADVPANLSDVVAIAVGQAHGLALKDDGTVVGWGSDLSGQATPPEGLSDVVAIAAGPIHSLALKSDGTVVAWGNELEVPSDLGNVVAISAGTCNLAISADLKIHSIGWTDQSAALRFQTFSGRQYTTEYSTDLNSSQWLPLPGLIEGTGRIVEWIDLDATANPHRFYRLIERR